MQKTMQLGFFINSKQFRESDEARVDQPSLWSGLPCNGWLKMAPIDSEKQTGITNDKIGLA